MQRDFRDDDAALDRLTEPEVTPDDPDDGSARPWRRQAIRLAQPPASVYRPRLSVDDARDLLRRRVTAYLAEPEPDYALVLAVTPGVGKTTVAVKAAESAAALGRRVAFLGPRRDFFGDIAILADHLDWWQPWDARQDAGEGRRRTCQHAGPIGKWIAKGHEAKAFCAGVCGWDYVKNACVWHSQKRDPRPIVFGQHQHLVAGHPREFDVVIVDESAINVFTRQWVIGERWIAPAGMDDREPMTEIMDRIANIATKGETVMGPDLLTLLGGAQRVLDACEAMAIDPALLAAPPAHTPEDAERAPYAHLPQVIGLLAREARAAMEGRGYLERVIVHDHHLHLLLRHRVNARMPKHRIILDATANRELLETLLEQPVEIVEPQIARLGRVYQVTDRANNISTVLDRAKNPTAKARQAQIIMRRIVAQRRYGRVGVITYQALESLFEPDGWDTGHFGGARGTNRFDQVDALFVLGTPMPDMGEILKAATMLYQRRMDRFQASIKPEFVTVNRTFVYAGPDGAGVAYPVSEFADPDLAAIHWQFRDAEMIQAAHRARINIREADVWLFANLPIDQLPPDGLYTFRDLMGSPTGIDVWRWPEIEDALETAFQVAEPLPLKVFAAWIQANPETAANYFRIIAKTWPDRWRLRRARDALPGDPVGAGRKPAVLIPSTSRYWGENGK